MSKVARRFASVLTVSAVAAALLAVGCGGDDEGGGSSGSGGAESVGKAKVLLSFQESIYWMPLLVAQDQGYFEDEGIELEVEATEGSGFVTQQIIAGNVDFGWAAAADDVIAFSKDQSLRALTCNPPQNIFLITVAEGSSVTSIDDLKGKTLGITEAGGGEEPIVNAALGAAGLERNKDVKILPIGAAGPQSLNAIKTGKVDAYASSYPDISALRAEGQALTDITPTDFKVIPGDCLLMKEETLKDEAKREFAVKMARAWAKGAVFAAANTDAAIEIACKQVPEECKDMAFAKQYSLDTIALSGAEDASKPFGVVDPAAWKATADLLKSTKTIQGDIDVTTLSGGADIEAFQKEYGEFDRAAIEQEAKSYSGGS
jgi:NitT/TauT family transport system substrate-binding protein